MSTIRLIRGDETLRTAVRELWQSVFGDAPDWIDAFLDAAGMEKTCFAALSGQKLAGMLFSLPAVLYIEGEAHESRYVYAVATDPTFRGKGIMTALEAFACAEAKREGVRYMALVPADAPLFAMYQKLGYHTAFHSYTARLPLTLNPQGKISQCTPEFFLYARRELLASHSVSLEFYPSMCMFRYLDLIKSGKLVRVRTPHGVGYVAFEKQEDTLLVLESSLSGAALVEAVSALCEEQRCQKTYVKGNTGTAAPFGMIKPLFEEKTRNLPVKIDGYMGLMLN